MNEKHTSLDAQQVVVDIYRRMPVPEKVRRIFDAYRLGRMLAMAGLKQLHPDANDQQLWYLWAKQHLGPELFNAAYGAPCNE
jgi:hypothetical protein